jgi:hypothetical protein
VSVSGELLHGTDLDDESVAELAHFNTVEHSGTQFSIRVGGCARLPLGSDPAVTLKRTPYTEPAAQRRSPVPRCARWDGRD